MLVTGIRVSCILCALVEIITVGYVLCFTAIIMVKPILFVRRIYRVISHARRYLYLGEVYL